MRIPRLISAVAMGSVLLLSGCGDAGDNDEGVDTTIEGEEGGEGEGGEDGEEGGEGEGDE